MISSISSLILGPPVHSTTCSYIDEPDSPVRDNNSVSMSPEPSNRCNLGPPALQANTALSQSYLNLIDDSASHHEEQEHSDEGSILFSTETAAGVENKEPEMNKVATSSVKLIVDVSEEKEKLLSNGHAKGQLRPPDIVLECLPNSQSTVPRTALEPNVTETNFDHQEMANERSKVKHGHSRTRQRNVHCLETEV